MTIEEKERQLVQEIDFFNHNIEWWTSEFQKVNDALCKMEKEDPLGLKQKETEKLLSRMKYLMGKANTEQRISFEIDKKLFKLGLEKELIEIQSDFRKSKKNKNY